MTHTATQEAGATHQLSDKEANKVAIGALIGTAMEWYDFFLFSAAAALVFNVQYFDSQNATAAAMAAFATFGVGLVARPVGGMIFGVMGDKDRPTQDIDDHHRRHRSDHRTHRNVANLRSHRYRGTNSSGTSV